MRDWLIKKLGGYATIEDAISAIDSKKDKHQILTKAVSHLFGTIGDNDFLRIEAGRWYYEGRELTEAEVVQLKSEVDTLKHFFLYKVLNAEVQYHTAQKMFYKSQTLDDLIAGKLIQYTWDIIKTKLSTIKKG